VSVPSIFCSPSKEGSYVTNTRSRHQLSNAPVYIMCTYFMQFLTVYFHLQVKKKPNDGLVICVFILGAGVVTNSKIPFSDCCIGFSGLWISVDFFKNIFFLSSMRIRKKPILASVLQNNILQDFYIFFFIKSIM
jgi:hypothetical protein